MKDKLAVVIDSDGTVYLRKVVLTVAPLSGRGAGTYTVVPIRWTERRLARVRQYLAFAKPGRF